MARGRGRSERVRLAMTEYIKELDVGHNNAEIAKKYGVNENYLSTLRPEIAKMHGIDPESLYEREHGKHLAFMRDEKLVMPEKYTLEQFNKELSEVEELMGRIKSTFEEAEEQLKSSLKSLEEEM